MTELWQFTKLIRSKNAGPFELTFDVMFKDRESFERVQKSGRLSAETVSRLYRIPREKVRFVVLEDLLAVKFSIPRAVFSGDVADTDVYGGQFHGPLTTMVIEQENR
ncbi:MAG: DUF4387 domain-containing protein [Terriglobia bacterium]